MRILKTTVILFVACLQPIMAYAQLVPDNGSSSLQGNLGLSGAGWSQFRNFAELQAFGLDVFFTVFLAALIVYHPVRLRARTSLADLVMPRLFFIYALIGMTVGFLVIQHGYIIGFVIFGIGALLRFKSNLDDPLDTVEMIMVTVLGLAVGMGLPVLAFIVTLFAWSFLWLGWRHRGVEILLKGETEELSQQASEKVELMAKSSNWKLINRHHVAGKSSITLLFQTGGKLGEGDIEAEISSIIPDKVEYKISL